MPNLTTLARFYQRPYIVGRRLKERRYKIREESKTRMMEYYIKKFNSRMFILNNYYCANSEED